jgi:hypothetical protein
MERKGHKKICTEQGKLCSTQKRLTRAHIIYSTQLALEIIQRNYRSRPLIRQREEMHIPRGELLRFISGKRRIFPPSNNPRRTRSGSRRGHAKGDPRRHIQNIGFSHRDQYRILLHQKCPTCDSRGKLIQVHPVQGT